MNVIDLGEGQWKRIANAAAGDFVRVPVEVFSNAAQAWRWMLGIVPQTEPVVKRAEVLEAMFAPPTDVADIAAVLAALSQTLPAPGEVERMVEIAIMADPNREHRDYRLNPIYEEEREQFRPAVRAILAALATSRSQHEGAE